MPPSIASTKEGFFLVVGRKIGGGINKEATLSCHPRLRTKETGSSHVIVLFRNHAEQLLMNKIIQSHF